MILRLVSHSRRTAALSVAALVAFAPACDASDASPAATADAVDTSGLEIADSAGTEDSAQPDTDSAQPDTEGAQPDTTPEEVAPEVEVPTEKFSFFVTSLAALQRLSGDPAGFGGDLRFGEEGDGAGLRGADKICATIAESSMAGAGNKTWRAFLSATDDGQGNQVDAIDRIGEGPWYDRFGRVFALKKADLLNDRPSSADAEIKNDFPNEDGVGNHQPDPTQDAVDNHDMLTGSNEEGRLYSASATCLDWTGGTGNKTLEGKPRVGHSWPRSGGPGGGGPGGGGPGGGGPGGDTNMNNWMSSLTESGCAPGVNLVEMGGPIASSNTVGSGGGYGGFYCFALTP